MILPDEDERREIDDIKSILQSALEPTDLTVQKALEQVRDLIREAVSKPLFSDQSDFEKMAADISKPMDDAVCLACGKPGVHGIGEGLHDCCSEEEPDSGQGD